jgi:hypothetical protein
LGSRLHVDMVSRSTRIGERTVVIFGGAGDSVATSNCVPSRSNAGSHHGFETIRLQCHGCMPKPEACPLRSGGRATC